MSAPSAPTLTELVTEGLKKAGNSNPSSAQITRASSYWMEEIKADIFEEAKTLKFLHSTTYRVLDKGNHRYSYPTDFSSDLSLELMYGTYTGTATGGASGSITLSATEAVSSDFAIGKYILVTSGTGKNSCSQITAYNTSTKVATVTPNFATAPVSGDGYMIIDTYYPLTQSPVWNLDTFNQPTIKNRPTTFYPIGDSDDGEYLVYPTPDQTYGVQIRYYSNLMKLDTAGTLMTTLYQRWRNLWIQGVYMKALQEKDDVRVSQETQKYYSALRRLIARETYGMDLYNLNACVTDY